MDQRLPGRRRAWPALLALLALGLLLLAGCAASAGKTDDNNRHGGFYGGVSGGVTWPR